LASPELAVAAAALPLWNYSVLSPVDGKAYNGVMVGTDPSTTNITTAVNAVVIPIRLNFQYNRKTIYTFDPNAADPGCLGGANTALSLTNVSPIFNDFDYNLGGTVVGSTQYVDAFQRANFWNDVSTNTGYHVLLNLVVKPVQSVTVRSSDFGSPQGAVYDFSAYAGLLGLCGSNTTNVNHEFYLGVMDINFWDPVAQKLVTNLGLSPDNLVIFLFYNAVMSNGNPTLQLSNCCILGYHNAFSSPLKTYATAEFQGLDSGLFSGADITPLSHEVAEWMDDPVLTNTAPSWNEGNIIVPACTNLLEVGDPLAGIAFPSVTMPNGYAYHPQELVFFSWFMRMPSPINGNWFSNNGTFGTDAGAVCQ
jgi:hypothetical protein